MRTPALAFLIPALALGACTTTGTGTGSTMAGDLTASISWQSNDGHSGAITARLSSGETFAGRYFQISQDTRVADLDPLWRGWGWPRSGWGVFWGPWRDWDYWGPSTGFITTYSGRVVANLEGPGGAHMRCRFFLKRPSSGMSGGGQGSCQLPAGQVIDTTFPPG